MAADVNQAFAEERGQQIASACAARDRAVAAQESRAAAQESRAAEFDQRLADGKLKDLGSGQFQVVDPGSWDDGEVLVQQQPTAQGEIALILPEHGLEENEDGVSLYSAVPAWHGLGTVIPGGTTDVEKVIELGGLDFEVEQVPVRYHDRQGELLADPSHFVNRRSDTAAALGVVGKVYGTLQPRESFTFLQELVDKRDVVFESAGVLRGGAQTFVSVRLPDTVTIDAGGIDDEIIPFVVLMDDHSGNARFQALVTPWRPVCQNTNRFALRDAVTKWGVRHTRTIAARVEEAQRTLGLSVKAFEAFAEEETLLAQNDLLLSEFDALLADLWEPTDQDASKHSKTREANRNDRLHELFAVETKRVGATAYAAEQSVTAFLDHVSPRRASGDKLAAARATAILEGADDKLKARAHALLLRRVR